MSLRGGAPCAGEEQKALNMMVNPNNHCDRCINGDGTTKDASEIRSPLNGPGRNTGETNRQRCENTKDKRDYVTFCPDERKTLCHAETQNWRLCQPKQRKKKAETIGSA